MQLEEFRPHSKLVTKTTAVNYPRFPVIDAHNHLGEQFGGGWTKRPVAELIEVLDQAGVQRYADLDGGWGEDILAAHLEKFKGCHPDRFLVFGGVNWEMWQSLGDEFPEWAAERLVAQKKAGAQGLKVWKNFGLKVTDNAGKLAKVDDLRLAPIWDTAGEYHLPIIIHVADPVAFFDPLDETNERWEELKANPEWHFPSPPYPAFQSIVQSLANLVRQHKNTIFIGAHVGCYAENLKWVSDLMEECQNFYVDISARLGELGRQPYTARKFFIENADRILFGSDMGPNLEEYRLAYRFLETDDEYFNYNAAEVPQQGRWYVNGLHLPDKVLQKVYSENAERVLINADGS
jgi:predicted TIM-barrel fold metal-dependent hydrolase